MVRFTGGLLLFSTFSFGTASPRAPSVQHAQEAIVTAGKPQKPTPRKLHGRFLHITDIHPDPFYKIDSASDTQHACHSGSGSAGPYGAEMTECDAPFSLVNATFQWINNNLKDQVDFVIWTGDSARHDNDEDYPRSEKQVVDLNVYIVNKFVEVFGKNDKIDDPDPTNDFEIPIVPTFGNNDVLPHNIFTPGPNKWTKTYASVWERFVPEEQRHSFARGGWFFVEVIPNQLAVFSINTLYFFDSNSAVDGCDAKSEPGYEHMEWLRIQLQFLRQRGMKAIMTGHVPPARTDSKSSWDETCWQKWTLWMRNYRDVVAGSVWGHMNIDHFMIQDVQELTYKFDIEGVGGDEDDHKDNEKIYQDDDAEECSLTARKIKSSRPDDIFNIAAKSLRTYLNELRDGWSSLPSPPRGLSYSNIDDDDVVPIDETRRKKKSKKQRRKEKFLKEIGGKWAERFSVDIVSPSVVPNYFPTIRVVEYNFTGVEEEQQRLGANVRRRKTSSVRRSQRMGLSDDFWAWEGTQPDDLVAIINEDDFDRQEEGDHHDLKTSKNRENKEPRKPSFRVPKPPTNSAPPGPAYSPQPFTFLGYTQYYANLTRITSAASAARSSQRGPSGDFKYEVEYDTRNDTAQGGGLGYGYGMKDLTVREWLGLAERIGRQSYKGKEDEMETEKDDGMWYRFGFGMHSKEEPKNHLWRTFVKRAFVGTKPDEQLEDEFG